MSEKLKLKKERGEKRKKKLEEKIPSNTFFKGVLKHFDTFLSFKVGTIFKKI